MKAENIILYEKAAIASSLIFTYLGIFGVRIFFRSLKNGPYNK